MKLKGFPFPIFLPTVLLLVLQFPSLSILGFCSQGTQMATTAPGGLSDSDANSNEALSLAQFAVDQHNNKENVLLELVRVVKAREQVVSGMLHHLTLEVADAGKKKLYEAKIWIQPWLNRKEVTEFKHIEDIPSSDSSDLGVKKDDELTEWRSVSVEDPVVQEAARHAIKTIQQRSNSLFPYELSEVLHANAQVVESSAKFDMLLKVKRGDKEEKFKVEVHRRIDEGSFVLSKMEGPHHP